MKRTGIVRNPVFLEHLAGLDHPESPFRLKGVYDRLDDSDLSDETVLLEDREATREEILYCHNADYYELVKNTKGARPFSFDPDTWVTARSFEAAMLAAGGGIKLVDEIMEGRLDNGFALIRPPGHHALKSRGMGFCIFNNIAIAAEHLVRKHKLEKVAIIDIDVHHGNGTEEQFYESKEVLYISTHQFPYYPGTGGPRDIGLGKGEGLTVNLPMPPGQEDCDYLVTYEEFILPILEEFQPQFILISAGFDTHVTDQLAGMRLSTTAITQIVEDLYLASEKLCGGRFAMFLEGGYDPNILRRCVEESTKIMLGKDRKAERIECSMMNSNAQRFLKHVKQQLSPYWESVAKMPF